MICRLWSDATHSQAIPQSFRHLRRCNQRSDLSMLATICYANHHYVIPTATTSHLLTNNTHRKCHSNNNYYHNYKYDCYLSQRQQTRGGQCAAHRGDAIMHNFSQYGGARNTFGTNTPMKVLEACGGGLQRVIDSHAHQLIIQLLPLNRSLLIVLPPGLASLSSSGSCRLYHHGMLLMRMASLSFLCGQQTRHYMNKTAGYVSWKCRKPGCGVNNSGQNVVCRVCGGSSPFTSSADAKPSSQQRKVGLVSRNYRKNDPYLKLAEDQFSTIMQHKMQQSDFSRPSDSGSGTGGGFTVPPPPDRSKILRAPQHTTRAESSVPREQSTHKAVPQRGEVGAARGVPRADPFTAPPPPPPSATGAVSHINMNMNKRQNNVHQHGKRVPPHVLPIQRDP